MAHPVLMPQAGQSMTEGKIVAWLKKEGETVAAGEPLLEIETDKANLEVEALDAGVLRKVFFREGEVVPVLSVIGIIGAAGEAIDFEAMRAGAAPPQAPPAPSIDSAPRGGPAGLRPEPEVREKPAAIAGRELRAAAAGLLTAPAAPGAPRDRVFASPLARGVAQRRGVDLSRVRGTGPGGRILRRDVETAPAGRAGARDEALEGPRVRSIFYPPPAPRPAARVPVEGMRKAIGTALQQSKQTIPHFYATISIDMSGALRVKEAREEGGIKVSVNDIITRGAAIALADEPRVNCRVYADRIEYPKDINIGIAVGSEEGLVVPVILRAEGRDLAGIAQESRRVVEAAGAGKLIGSGQGTFTISNLGMFGVESFTAIINPPEGAILAVGAIRIEVVPHAGGFVPRPVLKATLSADHRAIDGLVAARFLARLKHIIEEAERL